MGVQKSGFLRKYFVTAHRFDKKPGFLVGVRPGLSEKTENPQTLLKIKLGGFLFKSSLNYNLLGSIAGARRDRVLSAAALATSDGTESRNFAVNCIVVAS